RAARSRTPKPHASWRCSRQACARTAGTARRDREKAVAQQRRGLGRGLGALIQESPRLADSEAARGPDSAASAAGSADVPVEVFGAHDREIDVSAITPNPRQPRHAFDEEALDELAE